MKRAMVSLAAQKLKAWRQGNGLSLQAVCDRYRLDNYMQVWRLEAGKRKPSDRLVLQLEADGVCEPRDWFVPALPESPALTRDPVAAADGAVKARPSSLSPSNLNPPARVKPSRARRAGSFEAGRQAHGA